MSQTASDYVRQHLMRNSNPASGSPSAQLLLFQPSDCENLHTCMVSALYFLINRGRINDLDMHILEDYMFKKEDKERFEVYKLINDIIDDKYNKISNRFSAEAETIKAVLNIVGRMKVTVSFTNIEGISQCLANGGAGFAVFYLRYPDSEKTTSHAVSFSAFDGNTILIFDSSFGIINVRLSELSNAFSLLTQCYNRLGFSQDGVSDNSPPSFYSIVPEYLILSKC